MLSRNLTVMKNSNSCTFFYLDIGGVQCYNNQLIRRAVYCTVWDMPIKPLSRVLKPEFGLLHIVNLSMDCHSRKSNLCTIDSTGNSTFTK